MKEQIKTPVKELRRGDSQPIRCTVQNTGNQDAHKIEEKVKAMKSEIKKNIQEPTVKRRKLGLKSVIWTRRKK